MGEVAAAIDLEAPTKVSLLALLVRRVLTARLADPRMRALQRRMRGQVAIAAGTMAITVEFGPQRIQIREGAPAQPNAWVRGDVAALLGAVGGRVRVRDVLTRRIAAGGDPRLLVQLWRLLH